jgi:N-acyl-D-amino-acid deacylase
MMDTLIIGGMIIDGSGNPGYFASVGIDGDAITILRGDVSKVQATQVIDANGKIVCPGFIDVHAHSALMILHDPQHLPKVHQGVTTELIGIDGNSYAPFTQHQDLKDFIVLNAGLEGSPPIDPSWSSVSEYLDKYDNKVSVNIAYVRMSWLSCPKRCPDWEASTIPTFVTLWVIASLIHIERRSRLADAAECRCT